jgi:hypothetical protein
MEKNPNLTVVSSRKLACLKSRNKYEPKPFTKFYILAPPNLRGRWRIRSVVQDELQGNDDVIVLLRKGLKVDEANFALYQVASLLKKASEAAMDKKKELTKGLLHPSRWIEILTTIFSLPLQLLNRGILWVKRYLNR